MSAVSAGTRRWQLLALIFALLAVIWLLAPVLAPFTAAALLAYLGNPMADALERIGLGRTLAVSVVFLVMLLVLGGVLMLLVPLIERQVLRLVNSLPDWAAWAQEEAAPWLEARLGISLASFDTDQLARLAREHIASAGGVAALVVKQVSRSGVALLAGLANLVLVPVVTFYLLRDWHGLVARLHALLPRSVEPVVARLARDSDTVLGGFLRGQLSVMVVLGTVYAVGLWAVGISVGPLIGMIAGLVSFVPYLGFIIGLAAGLVAALVQHHDWLHVFLVLGVFGVGQLLESYLLTPRLVGDKIGLHPVGVIFAVLAGGQLFGFTGVMLALPVAAVIMVVLRYLHARYLASGLYREGGEAAAAAATSVAAGRAGPLAAPTTPGDAADTDTAARRHGAGAPEDAGDAAQ